ncbi:TetR/AcrR family transcriptional regulator [Rhodospirillaceae bacterium SYSU D60014]|uniref:TetR/AcrR family transcriptional regulator n=1 Tax=Virgifigura deserti TaxID=2268457 RepID=UPI000E669B7C
MSTSRSKAERHAQTRAALLREARRLFAEHGFADSSTNEVVARAKVTRGALYYHFPDKRALFEGVFEAVAQEILARIETATAASPSPAEALVRGCRAFLDAGLDPSVRRIYLLDAPSVIGWRRWREIDARYAMGSLRLGIEAALETPSTRRELDAETLTYLLSGALNEAALWIAEAPDAEDVRRRCDASIEQLVRSVFEEAKA